MVVKWVLHFAGINFLGALKKCLIQYSHGKPKLYSCLDFMNSTLWQKTKLGRGVCHRRIWKCKNAKYMKSKTILFLDSVYEMAKMFHLTFVYLECHSQPLPPFIYSRSEESNPAPGKPTSCISWFQPAKNTLVWTFQVILKTFSY